MKLFDSIIRWLIELIYSKDRTRLYLILIILLGLVLRLIAGNNLMLGADDSHFATHAMNFTSSGKLGTYDQSTTLWYYLTDIFYSIFGVSQITSRLVAIIFGTLTIPLIFILAKEFFTKRAALFASFIIAVSPWHVKNTLAEMDVLAMFFVLLSVVLFYKGLKREKSILIFFSALPMGFAFLTKAYTPLFAVCLIIFSFYYSYKTGFSQSKNFKRVLIFGLILLVFALPLISNNYLLYKEKGITDFLVGKTLGIAKENSAKYYSWDPGWEERTDLSGFLFGNSENTFQKAPTSIVSLGFFFFSDILTFALVVLGIALLLMRKQTTYLIFAAFLFILPWIYLGSNILLSKHYLFQLIFLAPIAGNLIDSFCTKFNKIKPRYTLLALSIGYLVLLGIQFGGSYYTYYHFYSESPQNKLMEFKSSDISGDSLVVLDERIYRGQDQWIFNDRFFVEGPLFMEYLTELNKGSFPEGNKKTYDVYFIECGLPGCGWSVDESMNTSMTYLTRLFQDNGELVEVIKTKKIGKSYIPLIMSSSSEDYFRIYHAKVPLTLEIFQAAIKSKVWFLYPINYDERITPVFDKYSPDSNLDKLIYTLAKAVIYISIILAFVSIIFVLYEALKNEKE